MAKFWGAMYVMAQFTTSSLIRSQPAGFEIGWYSPLHNLGPIQNYGHTAYVYTTAFPRPQNSWM